MVISLLLDTKRGGSDKGWPNGENKRADDQETAISQFQSGKFNFFDADNIKTKHDMYTNLKKSILRAINN